MAIKTYFSPVTSYGLTESIDRLYKVKNQSKNKLLQIGNLEVISEVMSHVSESFNARLQVEKQLNTASAVLNKPINRPISL